MAQLTSFLLGMDWLPWAQGPRLIPSAMAGVGEGTGAYRITGLGAVTYSPGGAGRAGSERALDHDGLYLCLYSIPCVQILPKPFHSLVVPGGFSCVCIISR